MDYELSENQVALIDGLDGLLSRYKGDRLPESFFEYDDELATELRSAGYLNVGREEGYGLLDAALVAAEVAQLERVVEVGASALIAPRLSPEDQGPYAVTSYSSIDQAIRFLPVAQRLLIEHEDRAYEFVVEPSNVEAVQTVMAYPFGRLKVVPKLAELRDFGAGTGPLLRQWRRVAMAIEGWGAAQSAFTHTLAYVKDRKMFGRALGSFQAVQHRLAVCAEQISGVRWLALKAAWSGEAGDAAMAATHVQAALPQLLWDLHQFNGAQGWTLSNPLHFWTFRLRALQGEMGGANEQALAVASAVWGE